MANNFQHPYQEFNSKRALFHHLRVDHDFDASDLPSYYYVGTEKPEIGYGPLLADHEEFHTALAKQRVRARHAEARPEDLG